MYSNNDCSENPDLYQDFAGLSMGESSRSPVPRSAPSAYQYPISEYSSPGDYSTNANYRLESTGYSYPDGDPAGSYSAYGDSSAASTTTPSRSSNSRQRQLESDVGSLANSSVTSTSDFGGYGGSDAGSAMSPSAGSSYGSYYSSDYARTVSSSASSAPSRHGPGQNFQTFHQQFAQPPAPRSSQSLPCEFRNLTNCTATFAGDDREAWMDHTEEHLGNCFPAKLLCWFSCDHPEFDSERTAGGDGRYNFRCRMQHIRDHILSREYGIEDLRPDGFVIKHLLDRGLISRRKYDDILRPDREPGLPASHNRGHSSRHLPPVDEVVASSSRDRRDDKRRERERDAHRKKGSSSRNR